MSGNAYPWANKPQTPFTVPVPVPTANVDDAPTVCYAFNVEWLKYIIGACWVLCRDSTYTDPDPANIDRATQNGFRLLEILSQPEECPVPVEFRLDPSDAHYWDYSTDAGVTWTRQPDTVSHFTPEFPVDGGAPAGYDLTVNGDLSSTPIPLVTATDPNAVITDPASLLRNLITAGSGAEGLIIQALATIGVQLVKSNGIAMQLNKIPGLGLATSALEVLAGGTDYTYDLLQVLF